MTKEYTSEPGTLEIPVLRKSSIVNASGTGLKTVVETPEDLLAAVAPLEMREIEERVYQRGAEVPLNQKVATPPRLVDDNSSVQFIPFKKLSPFIVILSFALLLICLLMVVNSRSVLQGELFKALAIITFLNLLRISSTNSYK